MKKEKFILGYPNEGQEVEVSLFCDKLFESRVSAEGGKERIKFERERDEDGIDDDIDTD